MPEFVKRFLLREFRGAPVKKDTLYIVILAFSIRALFTRILKIVVEEYVVANFV